jgi:hypothetical protein
MPLNPLLIQLAIDRVKRADDTGYNNIHKDKPQQPPYYRPAFAEVAKCASCMYMIQTGGMCDKYNVLVDPNFVCNSYRQKHINLPDAPAVDPGFGDQGNTVSQLTGGTAEIPKMASSKHAFDHQTQPVAGTTSAGDVDAPSSASSDQMIPASTQEAAPSAAVKDPPAVQAEPRPSKGLTMIRQKWASMLLRKLAQDSSGGDGSDGSSLVGSTGHRRRKKKHAFYKLADWLNVQAPGQFGSGSIAPPVPAAAPNAAAKVNLPSAQPLVPADNQDVGVTQQANQNDTSQQTTNGRLFKPSPLMSIPLPPSEIQRHIMPIHSMFNTPAPTSVGQPRQATQDLMFNTLAPTSVGQPRQATQDLSQPEVTWRRTGEDAVITQKEARDMLGIFLARGRSSVADTLCEAAYRTMLPSPLEVAAHCSDKLAQLDAERSYMPDEIKTAEIEALIANKIGKEACGTVVSSGEDGFDGCPPNYSTVYSAQKIDTACLKNNTIDELVKMAAPRWMKMYRSGQLSPQSLQRITSSMPGGQYRTVKPLGHGAMNLAEQVAGNVPGASPESGLSVFKQPLREVDDLQKWYQPLVTASNRLEQLIPGRVARYTAATPRGVFQEYVGDEKGKILPPLPGLADALNRPLRDIMWSMRAKRQFDPRGLEALRAGRKPPGLTTAEWDKLQQGAARIGADPYKLLKEEMLKDIPNDSAEIIKLIKQFYPDTNITPAQLRYSRFYNRLLAPEGYSDFNPFNITESGKVIDFAHHPSGGAASLAGLHLPYIDTVDAIVHGDTMSVHKGKKLRAVANAVNKHFADVRAGRKPATSQPAAQPAAQPLFGLNQQIRAIVGGVQQQLARMKQQAWQWLHARLQQLQQQRALQQLPAQLRQQAQQWLQAGQQPQAHQLAAGQPATSSGAWDPQRELKLHQQLMEQLEHLRHLGFSSHQQSPEQLGHLGSSPPLQFQTPESLAHSLTSAKRQLLLPPWASITQNKPPISTEVGVRSLKPRIAPGTTPASTASSPHGISKLSADFVKMAAPRWMKMYRSGQLSPQSLQRIAFSMPEGQFRTVKPLGHGAMNLAKQVAGNVPGADPESGLGVFKQPLREVDDLQKWYQPLVTASNRLEQLIPGRVARYTAATPRGVFQEYVGDEKGKILPPLQGKILPPLPGLADELNRPLRDVVWSAHIKRPILPILQAGHHMPGFTALAGVNWNQFLQEAAQRGMDPYRLFKEKILAGIPQDSAEIIKLIKQEHPDTNITPAQLRYSNFYTKLLEPEGYTDINPFNVTESGKVIDFAHNASGGAASLFEGFSKPYIDTVNTILGGNLQQSHKGKQLRAVANAVDKHFADVRAGRKPATSQPVAQPVAQIQTIDAHAQQRAAQIRQQVQQQQEALLQQFLQKQTLRQLPAYLRPTAQRVLQAYQQTPEQLGHLGSSPHFQSWPSIIGNKLPTSTEVGVRSLKPRIAPGTVSASTASFPHGISKLSADFVKMAAPRWMKMYRSGKLSPQSLQQITSSLPAGQYRTVRPLGHGALNLAKQVAGNVPGADPESGLGVFKQPLREIDDLQKWYQPLVTASNRLEQLIPGRVARYTAATPRGVFQEYVDSKKREILPPLPGLADALSRPFPDLMWSAELREPIRAALLAGFPPPGVLPADWNVIRQAAVQAGIDPYELVKQEVLAGLPQNTAEIAKLIKQEHPNTNITPAQIRYSKFYNRLLAPAGYSDFNPFNVTESGKVIDFAHNASGGAASLLGLYEPYIDTVYAILSRNPQQSHKGKQLRAISNAVDKHFADVRAGRKPAISQNPTAAQPLLSSSQLRAIFAQAQQQAAQMQQEARRRLEARLQQLQQQRALQQLPANLRPSAQQMLQTGQQQAHQLAAGQPVDSQASTWVMNPQQKLQAHQQQLQERLGRFPPLASITQNKLPTSTEVGVQSLKPHIASGTAPASTASFPHGISKLSADFVKRAQRYYTRQPNPYQMYQPNPYQMYQPNPYQMYQQQAMTNVFPGGMPQIPGMMPGGQFRIPPGLQQELQRRGWSPQQIQRFGPQIMFNPQMARRFGINITPEMMQPEPQQRPDVPGSPNAPEQPAEQPAEQSAAPTWTPAAARPFEASNDSFEQRRQQMYDQAVAQHGQKLITSEGRQFLSRLARLTPAERQAALASLPPQPRAFYSNALSNIDRDIGPHLETLKQEEQLAQRQRIRNQADFHRFLARHGQEVLGQDFNVVAAHAAAQQGLPADRRNPVMDDTAWANAVNISGFGPQDGSSWDQNARYLAARAAWQADPNSVLRRDMPLTREDIELARQRFEEDYGNLPEYDPRKQQAKQQLQQQEQQYQQQQIRMHQAAAQNWERARGSFGQGAPEQNPYNQDIQNLLSNEQVPLADRLRAAEQAVGNRSLDEARQAYGRNPNVWNAPPPVPATAPAEQPATQPEQPATQPGQPQTRRLYRSSGPISIDRGIWESQYGLGSARYDPEEAGHIARTEGFAAWRAYRDRHLNPAQRQEVEMSRAETQRILRQRAEQLGNYVDVPANTPLGQHGYQVGPDAAPPRPAVPHAVPAPSQNQPTAPRPPQGGAAPQPAGRRPPAGGNAPPPSPPRRPGGTMAGLAQRGQQGAINRPRLA